MALTERIIAVMKKLIISAALAATSLTGVAVAAQQQPAPAGRHHFDGDANNDGIATREEVLAAVDARFARQDADKNGQLSTDEMKAGHDGHHKDKHGKRGGRMMKRLDTNGDGQLSDAEKQTGRAKLEARLDTNGDGTVSADERQAARAKWQGHRGGDMHGRMMARVDTNKDGQVSQAEFRAMALDHFAKADANGDGRIDQAERDAERAKMKARFEQMRHRDAPPTE